MYLTCHTTRKFLESKTFKRNNLQKLSILKIFVETSNTDSSMFFFYCIKTNKPVCVKWLIGVLKFVFLFVCVKLSVF